jgi:hypothetical protein
MIIIDIKQNALTKTGKINHHFINRLTDKEIESIYKITDFCPEYINIKIRIKLIINDINVFPKCIICNNDVKACAKGNELLKFCSDECSYQKRADSTKESNIKKYGVSSTNKLKKVKEKIKSTLLKNHGVESYTISSEFREKSENTKLKKYGDKTFVNPKKCKQTKLKKYDNPNYNNTEKFKETCKKKYGVNHPMQVKKIFEKQQNSLYKSKYYKGIYYRSKSEYKFLLMCEKYGILQHVQNCDISIRYSYNEYEYIYYPDFIIGQNNIIEIKTSWSYNKNGKDKELGLKNDAKWESAKNLIDYNFHIIMMRNGKESTNSVKKLADSILKNII